MSDIVEIERVEKSMVDVLARRVRFMRRIRALTQDELGILACVNRKSITNLENGANISTLRVVIRLARALDVPMHLLFAPLDIWLEFTNRTNIKYEE